MGVCRTSDLCKGDKLMAGGSTASKIRAIASEKTEAYALSFLKENEAGLPEEVSSCASFLSEHGIGFILSRNHRVGSCREARTYRYRLGHVGIPLCDELKSLVCSFTRTDGTKTLLAAHCRADLEISIEKLKAATDTEGLFEILDEDALAERFSSTYGTVNPMLLETSSREKIRQVFDPGVMTPQVLQPGTMMTNAGHHEWGVEFDAADLVSKSGWEVADIAIASQDPHQHEVLPRLNPRSIGIITGNGPDSGMALWKQVNNTVLETLGQRFLGDLSLPEVHIVSKPGMGLSMELEARRDNTWQVIEEAVIALCADGVKLIGLACHTTHFFAPRIKELAKGHGVTFVSMVDIVTDYLRHHKIEDFALLGIPHVAELGDWSGYHELQKLSPEQLEKETLGRFLELGYLVKQMQSPEKGFQRLRSLIRREIKSKHVVIALTELSILLEGRKRQKNEDVQIIDALSLYGRALGRASIGLPWQAEHL